MNTAELLARLQRHYIKPGAPLPGGVFVPECGWNGSTGRDRRCDALFVGFTSTTGQLLVGHELKVSRSDWLHELDQPHKAGAWADECHQWWVVAPDTEVVRVDELPDGWGLMVPGRSKTRLNIVRGAHTHRDRVPSWRAVRSIIARQDTLRMQERKADDDVDARAKQRAQELADRTEPGVPALRAKVAKIEDLLGFRLDDWAYGDDDLLDWDTLRHACRLAKAGKPLDRIGERLSNRLAAPTRQLRELLKDVDQAVASVRDAAVLIPAQEQPELPLVDKERAS